MTLVAVRKEGEEGVNTQGVRATMGLLRRLKGSVSGRQGEQPSSPPTTGPEPLPAKRDDSWYVPNDGNKTRFVGEGGIPRLHLIRYRDSGGELVLRLCEDATGLLVGPTDMRLPPAGIYVSQLRGEAYYQDACRVGDFSPGAPVRLVREPENPHDLNAVAVYDRTGQQRAAYVNKQMARRLAKLLDAGEPLQAVSIRGMAAGTRCDQIAVLAARPEVLARLLEPRPRHLPPPAHER